MRLFFYNRKLTDDQQWYTVIYKELIRIIETLKKFRTIFLSQKIRIYTDHKNLTYENFNNDRVLRWILIIEEYGPDI